MGDFRGFRAAGLGQVLPLSRLADGRAGPRGAARRGAGGGAARARRWWRPAEMNSSRSGGARKCGWRGSENHLQSTSVFPFSRLAPRGGARPRHLRDLRWPSRRRSGRRRRLRGAATFAKAAPAVHAQAKAPEPARLTNAARLCTKSTRVRRRRRHRLPLCSSLRRGHAAKRRSASK